MPTSSPTWADGARTNDRCGWHLIVAAAGKRVVSVPLQNRKEYDVDAMATNARLFFDTCGATRDAKIARL